MVALFRLVAKIKKVLLEVIKLYGSQALDCASECTFY